MVASRRLVAVEQRLAFVELADRARRRIEAQRQIVAVGAQARQHERIAAQIGRQVDVRLDQLALFVEEGVDALVQAHQGERNRIVARREDDREGALDQREFVDRDRDGVRLADLRSAFEPANMRLAVLVRVKRLEAVVEQGQSVFGAAVAMYSSPGVGSGAGTMPATRLKSCAALYARLPIFASVIRLLARGLAAFAERFALPFGPAQFMGGSTRRCDAEDNMVFPR